MTHMTIKKTMLESISRFKSSKGDLLRAQGMTMAVWAACLCPLLFLLNASLRPLALLCPLMLILSPCRCAKARRKPCSSSSPVRRWRRWRCCR